VKRRLSLTPVLLAALCLVLATLLYREIAAAPERFRSGDVAASARPAVPGATRFVPPPRQDFIETDRRPLFVASRRPIAGASQAAAGTSPSAPHPPPSLTLVGIIASPQQRIALIKVANSAEVRKVGEGETVGGWQVRRIFADHIVILANGTEQGIAFPPQPETPSQPAARGLSGAPLPPPQLRPAQRP
jgi:hypothetical protein